MENVCYNSVCICMFLYVDEYCTEPMSIRAGFFMCKPSQCDSFRAGTELHYVCNKNYEMRPGDKAILTCLPGGVWSREPPVCLPGLRLAQFIDFIGAVLVWSSVFWGKKKLQLGTN